MRRLRLSSGVRSTSTKVTSGGESKTAAGEGRTIPINSVLYEAILEHRRWYLKKFKEIRPELYVFPYGKPYPKDPTRHVTTLKTAWKTVRRKANVTGRWHDHRHTLITQLAENGAGNLTYSNTGTTSLVPPREPEMQEMEKYAEETDFPIIGAAAGYYCYQIARMIKARSVFEMGSGYGYSTAWFAKAVKENGGGVVHHVVWDAKLSEMARGHLSRLGFDGLIQYQVAEAVETLRGTSGTFDLIFNDINKEAYPASLPLIKEKLRSGGVSSLITFFGRAASLIKRINLKQLKACVNLQKRSHMIPIGSFRSRRFGTA